MKAVRIHTHGELDKLIYDDQRIPKSVKGNKFKSYIGKDDKGKAY